MPSSFEKIRKTPAYRVLAEAVMARILDGRLREGDPIPTEAQMCEMFGVNRSTVREGIRVLEEANLIRRESARRLVVSHPSEEEVGLQVERALRLSEITHEELWEAMNALEPTMARLAAQRASTALLARIDENLERTADALERGESIVRLDIEFHELVAEMSGNGALNLARRPISRLFFPSFQQVMDKVPVAGQRLLAAHRAIAQALRAGDAEAAERWMTRHTIDFRRGLELADVDAGKAVVDTPAARAVS
ncbi:MAG TPA: FCD domain-containing protein [Quisquiliibacterium sp.]|nr:FCD domain-containing protein [Quisquiliibacterium sp.]